MTGLGARFVHITAEQASSAAGLTCRGCGVRYLSLAYVDGQFYCRGCTSGMTPRRDDPQDEPCSSCGGTGRVHA